MQIAGLWRHPVKSLQGHPVARTTLTATGVAGDRRWALRDASSGAVLSAKREPRLLLASATISGEGVVIDLPGHSAATGPAAERLLSRWLDRNVTLSAAPAAAYVDEAHLHLLSEAELGGWDVRRFRPNVVVAGVASLDALVGERLRIGAAVVEVTARTKRCAMPTMAQPAGIGPALGKDTGVLRALAAGRDLRLGVYGRVVTPGELTVGDAVTLA